MKKTISGVLLALVGVFALVACGDKKTTTKATAGNTTTKPGTTTNPNGPEPADSGKTINFYCWNTEFRGRLTDYYPSFWGKVSDDTDKLKDGSKIVWTQKESDGGAYKTKLATDLATAGKVDMFLLEADYAAAYADKGADVIAEVGLTEDNLSKQYAYTKQVVVSGGKVRGVSWQATPGVYLYNESYAKAVYGEEYSYETVRTNTADWAKFDALAAKVEAFEGDVTFDYANTKDKDGNAIKQSVVAGDLSMIIGADDWYRVFANNATTSLMPTETSVEITKNLDDWAEKSKDYFQAGYIKGITTGYNLWGADWGAGQAYNGLSFGTFGCPWYIDFCLTGYCTGTDGKTVNGVWKAVEGPQGWFWGGTWMAATSNACTNADKKAIIKDIMYQMTCDATVAEKITIGASDFTNNTTAMNKLGATDSTYKSSVLQMNQLPIFLAGVAKIDLQYVCKYEQDITEKYQNAMHYYIKGAKTKEAAFTLFKTELQKVQQSLTSVENYSA